VTSLLRLVAVLPSVSIECDLMRSSLNAMRDLLEATVCRGSRTERVMLLMHQQTLRRLPELIQRCMEMDPESRPCLAQVICYFFLFLKTTGLGCMKVLECTRVLRNPEGRIFKTSNIRDALLSIKPMRSYCVDVV
jgi:hypothetical protein